MKKIPNPNNPLTGKPQSKEHIQKRINARRINNTYIGRCGEKNNFFGKPAWNKGKKGLQKHTEETKQLMRLLKLGTKQTEEHKRNSVINRMKFAKEKGYYKPNSERSRKISNSLKGRVISEEWKENLSKAWDYNKHVTPEIKEKQRKYRSEQIFPKKDSKPERMMQIALALNGIKFEKHKLFESTEFYHRVDLFVEPNICIEVDGNYWHNLPEVMNRDRRVNHELTKLGNFVIRVWESDIKKDANSCVNNITNLIKPQQPITIRSK